jgi:hypothetical protein
MTEEIAKIGFKLPPGELTITDFGHFKDLPFLMAESDDGKQKINIALNPATIGLGNNLQYFKGMLLNQLIKKTAETLNVIPFLTLDKNFSEINGVVKDEIILQFGHRLLHEIVIKSNDDGEINRIAYLTNRPQQWRIKKKFGKNIVVTPRKIAPKKIDIKTIRRYQALNNSHF